MAITSPIDQAATLETEPSSGARGWAAVRDFARRRTLGAIGAAVVLGMIVVGVLAGPLAP